MTRKHKFDFEHKDKFINEMDQFHDSRMTVSKIEEKSITFKFECIENGGTHYVKLNFGYELKDAYSIYDYQFYGGGKIRGGLEDDDFPNNLKKSDYMFNEFLYSTTDVYLHVYDRKNSPEDEAWMEKIMHFSLVDSVEIR